MKTPSSTPMSDGDESIHFDNFSLRYTKDGVWMESTGILAIIYTLENSFEFQDWVDQHTKEAERRGRIDELGKWRNAIANSPNYIERKDTLEWMDKRLAGLSAPQQSTGGGDE